MKRLFLLVLLSGCSTLSEDEVARDLYEKAGAHFEKGEYEDAAPLYAYVIRKRERIRDAHLRLAVCLEKTDRPVEALTVLERYLRYVDPSDADALRSAARLYAGRGYAEEAKRTYRKLLDSNPPDADEIRAEMARLGPDRR